MLQRICIGAALLALAGTALAEVYRWVDEDGVVHYSDQPREGAEEVKLDPAPAIDLPAARPGPSRPASRTASGAAEEDRATPGYQSLTFASPSAEETLWNIGGDLNVSLDLQPGLKSGHRVRVYFDGVPQTVSGTQFQLPEVYRGAHNLQAEVIDANGELLIRSEPIRFYVQQTTIVNPRVNPRGG